MSVSRKLAAALASGAVLAGTGGALAASAGASSGSPVVAGKDHVNAGCTNGVYSGYCGTQKNVSDNLAFSYKGYSDWFTFGYQGGDEKIFEFASLGVARNICITDPSSTPGTSLVLTSCTGAANQRFTATPGTNGGFTWTNVATGLVVQDNGSNQPLTAQTADGGADQEWNFTTS
jgi:hypothetical protein